MHEPEPERLIAFPLHEFIAMIETYLTPNHPVYNFVFKHYQQQILERFNLDD